MEAPVAKRAYKRKPLQLPEDKNPPVELGAAVLGAAAVQPFTAVTTVPAAKKKAPDELK